MAANLLSISFLLVLTVVVGGGGGDTPPPFTSQSLPTSSGYLPIAAGPNSSSLFYAFYEAQNPLPSPSPTPILLWLQGGPGCSSLIGAFFELGPFILSPAAAAAAGRSGPSLRANPFSWNRRFGLLFIDNPLGTGFSATASDSLIPRNQSAVAANLLAALQRFLSSRPGLRSRPLFITGESYGGKYVPALGAHILAVNPLLPPALRVDLRGVAIGNGLVHPVVQVATYAESAYFTGLIGARQRRELEAMQLKAVQLTEDGHWSAASDARNTLLEWLQNATGLATLYDITKSQPYQTASVGEFLNRADVKAALGARPDVEWVDCNDTVDAVLHADVMKSSKGMVEAILTAPVVRVLVYEGVFDMRDGVVSAEAWMERLEWDSLGELLTAPRKEWRVGDGRIAGHVQTTGSGKLSFAVVMGAGHLVPADQPEAAQRMIEDWVLEQGSFAPTRRGRDGGRRSS